VAWPEPELAAGAEPGVLSEPDDLLPELPELPDEPDAEAAEPAEPDEPDEPDEPEELADELAAAALLAAPGRL
jgi:hypothetical protein